METTFIGVILPWFVALLLIILTVLQLWSLLVNRKQYSAGISTFTLIALLGIIVLGAVVRFAYVPNTHRIYYDEDRYMGYAVSFAKFNKAVSIELATADTHYIGIPDQAIRLTVPVLHGLILKTFGFSNQYLFTASKIISVLLIFSLFLLSRSLFKSGFVALLSSFLISLLPIQVYWSTSLVLDPYFVFFAVSALAATLFSATKPTRLNHVITSIWIFLLLCVRLEAFIFLPLFAYFFYTTRKEQNQPLFTEKDTLFLYFLTPLIFIRAFASISILGQKWCCAAALPLEAFSPKYFIRHILANASYFIFGKEFPFFFTLPAFAALLQSHSKKVLGLGLWIIIFTLFYSFYYAGLFYTPEFSGSYGRYFLILLPPLILLFSLAVKNATIYLARSKKGVFTLILLSLLYAGLIYQSFRNYTQLISQAPASFDQVDVIPKIVIDFLKKDFVAKTPKNALLIHPITNVPILYGRGAVYQEYFFNDEKTIDFVEQYIRSGKPVYIIGSDQDYCNKWLDNCNKIERFSFKKTDLVKENQYGFYINQVVLKESVNKKK